MLAFRLNLERGVNMKPDKCCDIGNHKCQVPMPIRGRVRGVDFCIANIVAALNAANIVTDASCCGHGKMNGNILLEDGRMITISQIERDEQGVVKQI